MYDLVPLCQTIAMNVKEPDNTSKLKWPTLDVRNLNKNILIKKWKSLSLTKNNKDKNVNKLISSNITSLINNGMRIFSRHSKKMLKLLDHLGIDIPKKLSKTDNLLRKSFHLTSNSHQIYWTSKSNKLNLLSKRSKFLVLIRNYSKHFAFKTIVV